MKRGVIIAMSVLLSAGVAAAQDRGQDRAQDRAQETPQQRPPAVDPKACAPGDRLKPGDINPSAPATTGENLSDKLARTDGVICPPNVDPEIRVPAPNNSNMPVIPPPGSPGGDPSVRPK